MRWASLVSGVIFSVLQAAEPTEIQVHGHRGARAARPENTIPAFAYALQAGVDVLELDLAVTKDNILVVSHDSHLNAPVCNGPRDHVAIRSLTFEQTQAWDCGSRRNPGFPQQQIAVGARLPRFQEVLNLGKPHARILFNVETKISPEHPELAPAPEEFARLVLEAVRELGLEERIILQSFDFRTLHAMQRIAPRIRRAALFTKARGSFVDMAREAKAGIVAPHHSLVTKTLTQEAHNAGLQVVPWTANTEQQWKPLVQAGVDAIITDDPAALLAYLGRGKKEANR